MIILNSLRRGNYRMTACKEAGIATKTFETWMKNPGLDYQDFAKKVVEIEAQVESKYVGLLLQAGEREPKWWAWWLERKCKDRWNGGVHRWEIQVLQRQVKQLRGVIDELTKTHSPDGRINTEGVENKEYPFTDFTSI